jgi:hypothetical protein
MFLVALLLFNTVSAYSPLDQWTQRSTAKLNTVRFVGGMFIGVGPNGVITTSSNGVNWVTRATNSFVDEYYGVAYNGSSFLVVGNNRLLGSLDAITWTNVVLTNELANFRDVTTEGFGGRFYVVAAADPFNPGTQPSVLVSPMPPTTNWQSIRLTNAASCDGFSPPGRASFSRIIRTSTLVAIGDICTGIWTSANGTTWTYRSGTAGAEYFEGVAYNGTTALAIGREGPPYAASSPFSTWTALSAQSDPQFGPFGSVGDDICFANNRFVAIDYNNVYETVNGSNWIKHLNVISGSGKSIAYGHGTFVVGGLGGIFQSGHVAGTLAVARPAPSGPVEVSINIESNRSFVLQVATNDWAWSDLWRSTNFGTNVKYLDWSVTNGTKRFYRTATP